MQYREFLLFVYLYIAYSDYRLELVEVEVIKNNLFDHFKDEALYNSAFKKLWKFYSSLEKKEIEEIIVKEFENLRNQEMDTERILNDLEEIMESDGIVFDTEVVSFDKIKKMMLVSLNS